MGHRFWILLLILAVTPDAIAVETAGRDWDRLVADGLPSVSGASPVQLQALGDETGTTNRELTPMLTMARQHWDELTPDTRTRVQPWLARPDDSCSTAQGGGDCYTFEADWRYDPALTLLKFDTDHFRIHYAVNDTGNAALDRNTANPAFAVRVGEVLEAVYREMHQTLAYRLPPSDQGRGGDGRLDVYLTELRRYGLYGYVVAEGGAATVERPFGGYSYMVLDNDYRYYGYADTLPPLQVTAAHEYFHVVQNGYSMYEDPSFMEQSATWMEDIVYPDIHDNYAYIGEPWLDENGDGQYSRDANGDGLSNDPEPVLVDHNHNYLRDYGSQDWPELPLDAYNDAPLVQYGRFLWVRYLHERFGLDIVREIWERAAVSLDGTFNGIDAVLRGHDSSLAGAVHEYALWAYDKDSFSDGYNYSPVWIDRTTTGPSVSLRSLDSPSLQRLSQDGYVPQLHLSSVYQQLYRPSGAYHFSASGANVALTMMVDYGDGILYREPVVTGSEGGVWQAPEGVHRAVAVVTNTDSQRDGLRWGLVSVDRINRDNSDPRLQMLADKPAQSVGAVSAAGLLLLCLPLAWRCRTQRC